MGSRSEQQAEKKLAIAELTKIAKSILIDGFKDKVDGSPSTSWGYNDTGTWVYLQGTKRYTSAAINISPSSSKEVSGHIRISYYYELLDSDGNLVNTIHPQKSYTAIPARESGISRSQAIMLENFIALRKHNTRSLLNKESINLKISRRPTEEEQAWAASVISNAGIKSDAGSHVVTLEYTAVVKQVFTFRKTNGVDEAISKAQKEVETRPTEGIVAAKLNYVNGTSKVFSTAFSEETVYTHSYDYNEFSKAKEI